MDMHKTYHHQQQQQQKKKVVMKGKRNMRRSSGYQRKEAVKVVYISTPMKVKTSASKFRDIVQELTGRDSDVVRIMETNGGRDTWNMVHDHDDHQGGLRVGPPSVGLGSGSGSGSMDSGSSPTSSSEEMVNSNNMFEQEGFCAPFDVNLLYDQFCHQLDMLGSY